MRIMSLLLLTTFLTLFSCKPREAAQDNIYEDMINAFKFIDEVRKFEQAKILDYNDLPGTYWIMEEPIIIKNDIYFSKGYIFLNNNYVLTVEVDSMPVVDVLNEHITTPITYISFIDNIYKYNIIDEKIYINNECFGFIKNTNLYIYDSNEYRKYRLEKKVSIIN